MIDDVLSDIRQDFNLLERSGFTTNSAMVEIKGRILRYMTTQNLSYAEAIRLASSIIFIMVSFRKGGEKNGRRLDAQGN